MNKVHRQNPQLFKIITSTYYIDSYLSGELTVMGLPWFRYLCVGNKYGMVVPHTISESEKTALEAKLPCEVKLVVAPDSGMTALGNIIACNDSVALVHPEIPEELEECLKRTLYVKVHRVKIAGRSEIGMHCCLTNQCAIVNPETGVHEA